MEENINNTAPISASASPLVPILLKSEEDNVYWRQDLKNMLDTISVLQKRIDELSSLRKDVHELKGLNQLRDEAILEMERETQIQEEFRAKGVEIPHLLHKVLESVQNTPKRVRGKPMFTVEQIKAVQHISKSGGEAAKRMGVTYKTYWKYCKHHKIPTSLTGGRWVMGTEKGKYPLSQILQNKFPDFPINRLKDRLIRSGMKLPACELCGYKERRITDGKIPLLINFEDGNHRNHAIENMKIYCYNCTFTAGSGYMRRGVKTFDPDYLQDGKNLAPTLF